MKTYLPWKLFLILADKLKLDSHLESNHLWQQIEAIYLKRSSLVVLLQPKTLPKNCFWRNIPRLYKHSPSHHSLNIYFCCTKLLFASPLILLWDCPRPQSRSWYFPHYHHVSVSSTWFNIKVQFIEKDEMICWDISLYFVNIVILVD